MSQRGPRSHTMRDEAFRIRTRKGRDALDNHGPQKDYKVDFTVCVHSNSANSFYIFLEFP